MNGKNLIDAATMAAEASFPKGTVTNWIALLRLITPQIIEAMNKTTIEAETIKFVDKTQKPKPTKNKKA